MTGHTYSDYPNQLVYSFAAASRLLGMHPTTLFRLAKDGVVHTVDTPQGRKIHRDEIRRLSGEDAA